MTMRQEEQRVENAHPEAVRSEPVPVPPPGDRDDRTDLDRDGHADLDRDGHTDLDRDDRTDLDRDGHTDPDRDDRTDLDQDGHTDPDRDEFHKPGPVPTAFGATSVGGAVAASALASPRPEDELDPRTESTARPGDGAVDGPREGLRADPTADLHRSGDHGDDRSVEHGDEHAVDQEAGAVGYGSAAPAMVDPDAGDVPAERSDAGVPGEADSDRPAGTSVATEAASLFAPDMAQDFRDRWRAVQLRFVDDPRAAAEEAQSLVDEAIQALSSALAAQKNKLSGWQDAGSADTEQLRMALRHYRDFLDRVLGR